MITSIYHNHDILNSRVCIFEYCKTSYNNPDLTNPKWGKISMLVFSVLGKCLETSLGSTSQFGKYSFSGLCRLPRPN
jgi:hypothetical protein